MTILVSGFDCQCFSHFLSASLAQATLPLPLSKASREARSSFVKTEAYRLLSLLFATKPDCCGTELEKAAAKGLDEVSDDFLASVDTSLQDAEMRKAKRVRVVLKALNKFIHCLSSSWTSSTLTSLEKVQNSLRKLQESDSSGVKAACTKLVAEINEKVSAIRADDEAAGTPKRQAEEQASLSTKKSKKKKKKKKKR